MRPFDDRGPQIPMSVRGFSCMAVACTLLVTTGLGCILGEQSLGVRQLRHGDYAEAISTLRVDEAKAPEDPTIKRHLGMALYLSGTARAAEEKLREARSLNPEDRQAVLYLGRACDQLGNLECALEAYSAYLGLGGKGKAEVRARIQAISIQKATNEIREALVLESTLLISDMPENSIAVPDFANVTENDSLAPLSRGLAAMLITDLSRVKRLRILERQRIGILLAELELTGQSASALSAAGTAKWQALHTTRGVKERLRVLTRHSTNHPYYEGPLNNSRDEVYVNALKTFQAEHGLAVDGVAGPQTRKALGAAVATALGESSVRGAVVNPATAPRLGILLGARRFVQGSFVPLTATEIQLDAGLIETSAGTLKPVGPPVSGPLPHILHLEKELVYQVLGYLGIEPTPEERREIDRMPTDDFLAFMAFCRGLELEDQGRSVAAAEAYREARDRDPGFDDATTREEITRISDDDQDALDHAEARRDDELPQARRDRLDGTGEENGLGPGPDQSQADDDDMSTPDVIKVSEAARITVSGDLPR